MSFEYEEINKDIFPTSEYMKYLLIYEFTNINEIINVFHFMVNNSKQNIDKIKSNNNELLSESSSYDKNEIINNIKEELTNLRSEHILNESLLEIVKNYLVVREKIKKDSNENNYKDNLNNIFNIFNDGLLYKIEDLSDNDIFIRKLIIKIFEKFFFLKN